MSQMPDTKLNTFLPVRPHHNPMKPVHLCFIAEEAKAQEKPV